MNEAPKERWPGEREFKRRNRQLILGMVACGALVVAVIAFMATGCGIFGICR